MTDKERMIKRSPEILNSYNWEKDHSCNVNKVNKRVNRKRKVKRSNTKNCITL